MEDGKNPGSSIKASIFMAGILETIKKERKMKKPQVTTTTGVSGILGIWLATFGQAMPKECLEIMEKLTIQEWTQLVIPVFICVWSILQDEDKAVS